MPVCGYTPPTHAHYDWTSSVGSDAGGAMMMAAAEWRGRTTTGALLEAVPPTTTTFDELSPATFYSRQQQQQQQAWTNAPTRPRSDVQSRIQDVGCKRNVETV